MVRLYSVTATAVLSLLPASLAFGAEAAMQEGTSHHQVSGEVAAPSVAEGEPTSDEAKGRAEQKTRTYRERQMLEEALPDVRLGRMGVRAGGLVYAPARTEQGNGFGAEFYWCRKDGRLSGGALWFAGSLAPIPTVDAPIPHEDFTRRGYDSRWGLLYLFGRNSGRAVLVGGLGLAIVKVDYVDTSAITGWTWDGGTRAVFGLQAQLGALVYAGDNAAVRLGYDSQFGGFVGLTVGF
jgi:hypothetical protein